MTVTTLNENGQVISEERVDGLEGNNFTAEVAEEIVDTDGRRSYVLDIKNEHNKTVLRQTIRPTIFEVLGENYFDDEALEETVDKMGNKKRSILTGQKNTLVVKTLPRIDEQDNDQSQTDE